MHIITMYVCIYRPKNGSTIMPQTAVGQASVYYIITTKYFSSYYYVCVLILLYMCAHTICVLILLYMFPHTTICVLILLYQSPPILRFHLCGLEGVRDDNIFHLRVMLDGQMLMMAGSLYLLYIRYICM